MSASASELVKRQYCSGSNRGNNEEDPTTLQSPGAGADAYEGYDFVPWHIGIMT